MATRNKVLVGIVIAILAISVGFNLYWAGKNLLMKYQVDAFNRGVAAVRNSVVQQIKVQKQLQVNIDGKIITLKPEEQKRRK